MFINKFVIPAVSACAICAIGGVSPAAATDLTANLGVSVGGVEADAGASVGVGGHSSGGDSSGVNVGVDASVGSSGGGTTGDGGASGNGGGGTGSGGGTSGNGGQQPGDTAANGADQSSAAGANSTGDRNASRLQLNQAAVVGLPVFSADRVFIGTVEDVQGSDLIIDLHEGGTLQLTGGISRRSSQGIFLSASEASLAPYINRSFVKLAIK
ncbi:hypothetical protein [Thioclava sp. F36-7]|uniref:hypothetical protein n=1 Tax=Thioclava sp. F36-7 TaxID=1915317 RepID=UPI00117C21EC|nr:hypothetical protein [Thioclava sp. F36-7]